MADFKTYADALRQHLETNFTALPRYWPNDERLPSLDVAPNGFVYSEIRVMDEAPASLDNGGQRLHRDFGEFTIYVFVPHGSRIGTAEGYAEQIRASFGVNAVDGVHFTRRIVGPGERSENGIGRFWGVPVILQFFADRME